MGAGFIAVHRGGNPVMLEPAPGRSGDGRERLERTAMRTAPRLAALVATLAAAVPAPAALAPNYQRLAELRAVISHPGVARAFGADPVDRVEHVRPDLYRVTAGRCRIDVAIVDLPAKRGVAGPRRFDARPGALVCPR